MWVIKKPFSNVSYETLLRQKNLENAEYVNNIIILVA